MLRRRRNNNNNGSSSSSSCRPHRKSKHRLQLVADYKPGDSLKEGTQIFSLLWVQQKVEHGIIFQILDLTVLNSWIQLSSHGAKYTDRDFRLLVVRNLTEEAEKSQDRPNPRLVVKPSVGAKMFCDPRVAIKNTGQQNHQTKCATICVLFMAKERAQCITAPDVMWDHSRCLVS